MYRTIARALTAVSIINLYEMLETDNFTIYIPTGAKQNAYTRYQQH